MWIGGGSTVSQLLNWVYRLLPPRPHPLNNSWGGGYITRSFDSSDIFFDSLIWTNARAVVKSAGNRGASDGYVTHPGLGYNIITTGNYDDRNTQSWNDDIMSSTSSYVDPLSTYGDREKPEVSAPGTNIETTNTSGGVSNAGSGTSYAAPVITAVGALINHGNYAYWNEVIKAMVMVAATNNIEGSARLSDKDGAGGIYAYNIVQMQDPSFTNANRGWSTYSCSAATDVDLTNMYLISGKRTRVAIAWAQNPAESHYPGIPMADLDLRVVSPSNVTWLLSSSWDNNYEIGDFIPNQTGYWKLRVRKVNCYSNPGRIGWAWRMKP